MIFDRKIFVSIVLIIAGLFFVGYSLLKDKITSKMDLIEINASLRDFSFQKGTSKGRYYYFITLDGYNDRFQISADFVDHFNKDNFEENIRIGDTLTVYVPLSKKNSLNSSNRIELFGIYNNKTSFLDISDAIKQYNSRLPLFGGLAFVLAGLVMFYFNRKKFIKKESNFCQPSNPADR